MRNGCLAVMLVLLGASQAMAASARATIQATAPDSPVTGEAALVETPNGLRVGVHIHHAPPGQHGLHIHEHSSCAEAGNAAGGHYNPAGMPHGYAPKDGLAHAHPGDLGNIEIGQDGSGRLDIMLPGVALDEGTYIVADRAIILHEHEDDFGQPTGNAGGRIGCGVIVLNE